jgi:HEPN domain-containing protein
MNQKDTSDWDIPMMVKLADAFIFSTQVVVQCVERPLPLQLLCVLVVNHAFASELYLKCLKLVQSKAPATGHDLEELFKEQSRESQAKIRAHYQSILREDPFCAALSEFLRSEGLNPDELLAFDAALEASKLAFQKARYTYEGSDKPDYVIGPLAFATRRVISELDQSIAPPLPTG